MSTMRRNLASRSRGLRGEGVTAEMSRRAGTGAPGIGSDGSYWFSTGVCGLSPRPSRVPDARPSAPDLDPVRQGSHGFRRALASDRSRAIGCGLIAIGILVFNQENVGENRIPVLVYLPLPFLLWAAVRFRPSGVNTCLQIVASLAISGAVQGRGLRSPSALRPTTCLRSSCCWSRYPSR
jgi:hypothetical protein